MRSWIFWWVGGWLILHASLRAQVVASEYDTSGYQLPTRQPAFHFPHDHGSHPGFRVEWWYITGQLKDAEGREFGLQATFFRYALKPGAGEGQDQGFGDQHLFMAHMALSDLKRQRFFHEERLNRDGWDAWARVGDLDLRNGNWTLKRQEDDSMMLHGSIRGEVEFTLRLRPAKPLVFFGDQGFSKKGLADNAASWYLTFPRLQASGNLRVGDSTLRVTGECWMDHEISSSQLSEGQVGWDWASLRLDNGGEIMVYRMRTADGTADPYSTLAIIDRDGRVRHQGPDSFEMIPQRHWTSPETGGRYPVEWLLNYRDPDSGAPTSLRLQSRFDAQELIGHLGGVSYWEGACRVLNKDGKPIGQAYLEMTGYDKPMGKGLR